MLAALPGCCGAGLSPLTVISTVREMCEKLKVVVGTDSLSIEAQVGVC